MNQMTGPDHVREALRLTAAANDTTTNLSEDQRHRMLMTAHLHASLARTAALTDTVTTVYTDGSTATMRSDDGQQAWDTLFGVDR